MSNSLGLTFVQDDEAKVERLLSQAGRAESFSIFEATRAYEELEALDEKLRSNRDLRRKVRTCTFDVMLVHTTFEQIDPVLQKSDW